MKFCFVTTLFGAHSFGGDAVAVERLAAALLKRGHELHVIYPVDAFNMLHSGPPIRRYDTPPGMVVHALHSRMGKFSQLAIHQTSGLADLRAPIKAILDAEQFDVIHAHNISLIGGAGLLKLIAEYPSAVKLMTTHEHWLLCPLSVLWRFNREVCQKPTCITCTLAAGRPPQWWRYTNRLRNAVAKLDAIISPSRFTLQKHQTAQMIARRMVHVPYLMPDSWLERADAVSGTSAERPYFLAVGRLVKEKGFQDLLPAIAAFPQADLLIAGDGNYRSELQMLAAGTNNVHFLGYTSFDDLIRLYRNAIAALIPSQVLEVFNYIVVEALACGTPAIVRKRGPMPELIAASQGGLVFDTEKELVAAMTRVLQNPDLRASLGKRGQQAVRNLWSEDTVLQQYLGLIDEIQRASTAMSQ